MRHRLRSAALLVVPVLLAACAPNEKPAEPASAPANTAAAPATEPAAEPGTPQTPPVRGSPLREVKPAFEIVPPVFELGLLDPNDHKDLEFEVFNRSDRPFSVVVATTECKCMSLDFDRKPIEPGKSAKVRAKIRATTAGVRITSANIRMNDPAKSSAHVDFHYAIIPEVLLDPKKVEFGRILAGESVERTLQVTMHLPDLMKEDPVLEPFVQHALPITMKFDPPKVTASHRGMRDWESTLHVTLKADQPIESFETMLVFQPKAPGLFRTTMVPVWGEVAPAWFFERTTLALGIVDVGAETKKTMRFYWPGEKAPEVQELTCDVPDITVTQEVDAGRHCFVVTVKCVPTKRGKVEGVVTLKTSLSAKPDTLKVTGRAK